MTRQLVGLAVAMLIVGIVAACAGSSPVPGPSGADNGSSGDRATEYTVSIPRIGVERSDLAPVGLLPDRTIETPPAETPEQAAVYSGGPMPGEVGPAVILGHVNGAGRPGVFARLDELVEGDVVETTDPAGEVTRFVVYRTVEVEKADFPTAEVYSDVPGPELRLITCGGALDRSARSYVGQVIVFARAAA